jgi:serine/threonine-protein kinase
MKITAELSAGLAGRYVVEREIGRGGMAVVYLARDVKHDRLVAVKVLNPELTASLGTERFLAEIRTTATLQHPNLLPLYDSGEAGGLLYYVMPYIEGESLRARLEREQQLPVDDAVRIASGIANALSYAHGRGVIHRDLKPENVLLQHGQPMVLDFGIALALRNAAEGRKTQTGISVGTPQYMSPEQAAGEKTVDARVDIYALGTLTYEMLAGEPPHTGRSAQVIIAKVMAGEVRPVTASRPSVPWHVANAIHRALERVPADRFSTASEFARALENHTGSLYVGTGSASPPNVASRTATTARSRWRDPVVLGLAAGVVALAAVAITLAARRDPVTDAFPIRAVITDDGHGPIAGAVISPDGHSIVYTGDIRQGSGGQLYVRRLDQLTSRQIAGTNGVGQAPVFSPDGKWLAFIADRHRLMKVPIDGGAAVPLADAADDGGLDWSSSGEIIIGAGVDEGLQGLFRVSDAGGALVTFTRVDTARKELSHQSPRVLADGKTVLFAIWFGRIEEMELAVTSLDDGKVTPLGILGVKPLGIIDGQLVYLSADGVVMAVPFDLATRRTVGTPMRVQDDIRLRGGGGANHDEAFMTEHGALVYWHGNEDHRLMWVDRAGRASPALDSAREFISMKLSPNGQQAALTIMTGAKTDIWNFDLAAGTLAPVTTTGKSRNGMWSADGQRLLYASTHGGRAEFWWQPADGSGAPERAFAPPHNPWFAALAPDGQNVVFNAIATSSFDLETVSLDSNHTLRVLSGSPSALEALGRFSPDGRWVAYNSNESGRSEVYVRPFAGGGGRVQISVAGGRRPIWSDSGKQLYYWEGNRLISATLMYSPAPTVASRTPLFSGRSGLDYDVAADGSRFLMTQPLPTGLELVVIPNWRAELGRLTASKTQ